MRYDFEIPEGKIVIAGDTRPKHPLEFFLESAKGIPETVFKAIAAEKPTAFFHLGDIATIGHMKSSWVKTFEEPAKPVLDARIPIYPVLGNHEYKLLTTRGLAQYFSHFPELRGRRWYSARWGKILFLVLDSNFHKLGGKAGAQSEWLRGTLEEASKDSSIAAVISFFHHPVYTNILPFYLVFPSKRAEKEFLPLLESCPKFKMAMSGHVHAYEHFIERGKHYIVSGGGGSPRFALLPVSMSRNKDTYTAEARFRNFHYMRMNAGGSGVKVEMVEWNGKFWSVGETFVVE